MIEILLLLALITFTTRFTFLIRPLPFEISGRVKEFLSFSAPAVLTAIWAPIVLLQDNQLNLSFSSPYLWGAIVAMLVAFKSRNIYYTTGLSLLTFYLLLLLQG